MRSANGESDLAAESRARARGMRKVSSSASVSLPPLPHPPRPFPDDIAFMKLPKSLTYY